MFSSQASSSSKVEKPSPSCTSSCAAAGRAYDPESENRTTPLHRGKKHELLGFSKFSFLGFFLIFFVIPSPTLPSPNPSWAIPD